MWYLFYLQAIHAIFLRLIYEANTVVVSFDCHNMVVGELGVHPHSIVSRSAE